LGKQLTAIDFYSGIGGWSLGFELAGIKILKSYEWWEPANITHQKNLEATAEQFNIRELDISTIPHNVDFVIGSPPCTQFSYSNRGGSGDLEDGLQDIKKFLEIVASVKPRFWAMENVPRVAKVIQNEIQTGGVLEKFSNLLKPEMIHIIDMSAFGLPQRRKRCIIGNFDARLLLSYTEKCRPKSLGHVLDCLSADKVSDPNYAFKLSSNAMTDHEKESTLNWEELRFNRDAKTYHTVYNDMSFPERLDKPVRTVTATCTRVSRESIIIPENNNFRRLTIRERGCLQGFPINYQFFGTTYSAKIKMIGNAVPPVFTYYMANAFKKTGIDDLIVHDEIDFRFKGASENAPITPIDTDGKSYPENRSFRFAVPNLRFKSGTRFELSNHAGKQPWNIDFYYGDSKRIKSLPLDNRIYQQTHNKLTQHHSHCIQQIEKYLYSAPLIDSRVLQETWSKRGQTTHPFQVLDELGAIASEIISVLKSLDKKILDDILSQIFTQNSSDKAIVGKQKLLKYSVEVVAGLLLGSYVNSKMT
jgi:DNA (cytosine-5)-methyltransferase 1